MSTHTYLAVLKTVNRIKFKSTFGGVPGNYSATTSPEVNCYIRICHFVFFPNT